LTIGLYENFPSNIHMIQSFVSTLSSRQLQRRLIRLFYETNRKEFRFEEVANPTTPDGKVTFDFGLADTESFNYIDEEETKKTLRLLSKEEPQTMDFFCAIRYHKGSGEKKTPLKFDYYLLRTLYGKGAFEIQVFHERGPRYISPEDLTQFICNTLNEGASRKILKKTSN
jgi:hypothetical protein